MVRNDNFYFKYGTAVGLDICFSLGSMEPWSTMCRSASTLQVGDSQPKSVNTSPAKTRLLVTGREGRISEK